MLAYLSQNLGYIATAAVLALIVAAILVRGARARRSGKGRCGCGCAGCPNAGLCHPETARPEGPPALRRFPKPPLSLRPYFPQEPPPGCPSRLFSLSVRAF